MGNFLEATYLTKMAFPSCSLQHTESSSDINGTSSNHSLIPARICTGFICGRVQNLNKLISSLSKSPRETFFLL